ncbi:MAG: membrane-bound PQQ-dependent dehydrogenase, glucose/quinate/shikimate family, partial [Ensifer adhaerens]
MLILAAIVFALIGLALGGGGAKLLMLGGSPYYLIAGIGFLLTAILLFMRKAAAIWLYTLVILGSLTWAVWEVGFDWWQLGPRGGIIVLLGLWLMLPAVRRPLGFESPTGERYAASAWPLALAVLVSIGIAGYSM